MSVVVAMPPGEESFLPRTSGHFAPDVPATRRLSMEEYYTRYSSGSRPASVFQPCPPTVPTIPENPPPYDAVLAPSTSPRPKFNIQPREDEGREVLPPYSCAISLENVFLKKMELEGAVHRAHDRNWYRVVVALQGTALTVYKFKGGGVFSKLEGGGKPSADFPAGVKRGETLRSYNLQHAEVGVAADYLKKRFVIRVRAEADQFLLSCHKIETFVLWLQSLFAAIDLAAPLEDRDLPRDLSIPRPRRRRADRAAAQRTANLVREQEEIITQQFPTLAITETTSTTASDETRDDDAFLTTIQVRAAPTSTNRPRTAGLPSRFLQSLAPNSHGASNTPNPSISTDGKWRPNHQWSPFYDMLYAKRCMAILTSKSPRKTNLVIMKGKRWIVDWATGKITKWSPVTDEGLPAYVEDDKEEEGEWIVGQYGELIRV